MIYPGNGGRPFSVIVEGHESRGGWVVRVRVLVAAVLAVTMLVVAVAPASVQEEWGVGMLD